MSETPERDYTSPYLTWVFLVGVVAAAIALGFIVT